MLNMLARGMYLFLLAVIIASWALTAGKGDATQPTGHSAAVYMFT